MTGYREPTERDVSGGALRPKTVMEPTTPPLATPSDRYTHALNMMTAAQEDMMSEVIRGVLAVEIERAVETTIVPKAEEIAKGLEDVVSTTVDELFAKIRTGITHATASRHLLESFKSSDMICRLIGATAFGFALGLLASVFIS